MTESNHVAQLCLTHASVSFVAGTISLTVPSDCAERSTLISELRQELEQEVMLPLPLPLELFGDWLSCASAPSKQGPALHSDDILLGAHKAAGFLRDDKTRAEILDALATVVARALEDADLDPRKEDETCAQIVKVIDALPQPPALAILAAICHRFPARLSAMWTGQVELLLHLLPRIYHPAIVRAHYISESGSVSDCGDYTDSIFTSAEKPCCQIRTHPYEDPTRWRQQSMSRMRSIEAGHTTATTIFQLLAGAAPLAGGSLDLAWALPEHDSPSHRTAAVGSESDDVSSSDAGTCQPVTKRMRLRSHPAHEQYGGGDSLWQMASGGLKHLIIEFDVRHVKEMPSRWCTALAQLVSLLDLRIWLRGRPSDDHGLEFCMPEFSAALRHLPALTKLAMMFELNKRHCKADVIKSVSHSTMSLLETISQMPQLSHLDLHGCINVHNGAGGVADPAGMQVLSQLSRLSRLTHLELYMYIAARGTLYSSDLATAFACGLKHLPALEKLQLIMEGEDSRATSAAEEFVLELFTGPGLPALTGLHVSVDREHELEPQPLLPFRSLQKSIRHHHEGLLARVTFLDFGPPVEKHKLQSSPIGEEHSAWDEDPCRDGGTCDSTALAEMVPAMTSLQHLSLADISLGSKGLLSLACALTGLKALTHLDIANTCASRQAVLDGLAALLEPEGPGRERLRSLDLRSCCSLPARQHAVDLARLLGRFRALTHLEISQLKLGANGLREVVEGLGGLAQLRCVEARGNVPYSRSNRGTAADADLKEAAAAFIPAAELKL